MFAGMIKMCPAVGERQIKMIYPEETLTHEEIVCRFKTIFQRDMTPEERRSFFLPPDPPVKAKPPEKP